MLAHNKANKIVITFSKYFVSLAGIGFIPFAPGTFGSIIAILIWYLVISLSSIIYFYILFFLILLTSFKLVEIYLENVKKNDPSEVILDEFIGQSLPLLFIFQFNIFEILLAFATFRFFDIYKIYPVNKAEKIKGSFGVIMDDIVAGVYSIIIIFIFKLLNLL